MVNHKDTNPIQSPLLLVKSPFSCGFPMGVAFFFVVQHIFPAVFPPCFFLWNHHIFPSFSCGFPMISPFSLWLSGLYAMAKTPHAGWGVTCQCHWLLGSNQGLQPKLAIPPKISHHLSIPPPPSIHSLDLPRSPITIPRLFLNSPPKLYMQ